MKTEILGTSIEVIEQGSGEPVVLLHCSGSSSAQWRTLAAKLAARYRVIAPDLLGYGASAPWSGRGEFCLAQEAAGGRSLLGPLGGPAPPGGPSYGGAVGLPVPPPPPDLL